MLEASRVLVHSVDNENTLMERDNSDMEPESILHDNVSEMCYQNVKYLI